MNSTRLGMMASSVPAKTTLAYLTAVVYESSWLTTSTIVALPGDCRITSGHR